MGAYEYLISLASGCVQVFSLSNSLANLCSQRYYHLGLSLSPHQLVKQFLFARQRSNTSQQNKQSFRSEASTMNRRIIRTRSPGRLQTEIVEIVNQPPPDVGVHQPFYPPIIVRVRDLPTTDYAFASLWTRLDDQSDQLVNGTQHLVGGVVSPIYAGEGGAWRFMFDQTSTRQVGLCYFKISIHDEDGTGLAPPKQTTGTRVHEHGQDTYWSGNPRQSK